MSDKGLRLARISESCYIAALGASMVRINLRHQKRRGGLEGGRLKFEEAWNGFGHSEARDGEGAGLASCRAVYASGVPRYWTDHLIAPVRTIGAETATSLKLSYWFSTVEDSPQEGDPNFVSASLRTSTATAWRDAAPSGFVSMLPFEGAQWRFEQPVSFMQFHIPFDLMGMVCVSLFGKELTHDHIRMPADVLDAHLHHSLERIRHTASSIEPTNLLLDSWALILAETFLLRLSSHGERNGHGPFGKLPARGVARVVDYIEDGIDHDLRLSSLSAVAGMSTYHFARRFQETVGMSPHSYVLVRRIERARALLRRRDEPLVDVALACGFSSQSHLTTVFRRCLGVTPGEYRRRVQ
ncbi:AraC family transcriptional regulator [Rhizobium leguminosarum]|uniref:AraC family transcriptional regulator n=1 Tax=Rhizobium leguminosarum TaxID=384 RepID=UPI00103B8999|nr:AraC family transcriptional regulator [Rhizobium leguminosarum]TBY82259.1 AraC family transcriptional regulator [Rhizobium leguminosarum bv. viciae]